VVPAAAIVHEGEEAAVFVVDATSHAHRRVVVLGLVNAQEAEVKSGLQASDTVVVKGLEELPDGAQVVVEKE
jgi:Fe2+ transport system protein FeoA